MHLQGDNMKKYFHIWWLLSLASFRMITMSRLGVVLFTLSKMLRYIFFLSFLLLLRSKTVVLGQYTFWEVILFFTTYNFIDTTSQLFFREVYRFSQKTQRGEFDLVLLQPFSPLFRSLLGATDILDLPLLLISLLFIIVSIFSLPHVTLWGVIVYSILVLNGLCIALSFHIFILSVGLVSTSMDQILWIYRDVTLLGRIPVGLYNEPVRSFLTFIIPLGIMITFPPESLIGVLSPFFICIALLFGAIFYMGSLVVWRNALRYYTGSGS
jgi:ABC-2 type transport system permease protein